MFVLHFSLKMENISQQGKIIQAGGALEFEYKYFKFVIYLLRENIYNI